VHKITDKETLRIYSQLYRLEFPERTRKATRKYRAKNLNFCRNCSNNWNKTHREAQNITQKRYYDSHPEIYFYHANLRRAREQAATIGDPTAIKEIYNEARKLRKAGFKVAVDHIIPLSKGGAHSAENLQIIDALENAKKRNTLDYKPRIIYHAASKIS